MPLYEYVCDDCGYGFERIQAFDDAPLSTCPVCRGSVRRVISAVGVIFKGSGWYITDNRRQLSSAGAAKRLPAEGPAASGGQDGADKKTPAPAGPSPASD